MPGVLNWGWDPANKVWVPLRVDADGSIHVVGYVDKLNDIGDVSVAAPTDGYVLYWDAATGLWKSRKLVDADIPAAIARDAEVAAAVAAHTALTTGVHGITLAYPGESSVQALDLADHDARHKWLGADAVEIRDSFLTKISPFWYKNWQDAAGFTQANSGTGNQTLGWIFLTLNTGATSASKASIYAASSIYLTYAASSYRIRFALRVNFQTAVTNQTLWFGLFETPAAPTNTQKHIGFKIVGADIFASNADGTNQTITDTGINVVQYGNADLYFQDFGSAIYFYVDGVLRATHTTNRPTGVSTFPLLYIVNSAAEGKIVLVYPLMIHQGTE